MRACVLAHEPAISQLKSYLLRESNKALAGDNNADGFVGIDDIIFILTIYGTNCALE